MQLFQRPLKEMRDNTDGIRSDLHDVKEEVCGLKDVLRELPKEIKTQLVVEERIGHDAFVMGATEFGTGGLLVGLILGMFVAGALRK